MPQYFFNTRIGKTYVPDNEGVVLRDPDEAWTVARATILELLKDQQESPALLGASLEVTDAAGEIVLEFPFSEALLGKSDESPSRQRSS